MLSDKQKVSLAFKELRKLGYVARQNFMCCSSCAWYELGGASLSGHQDKTKTYPAKVVFYNQQANKQAWYDRQEVYYGRGHVYQTDTLASDLWLQWNGDGKEIVTVLESFGLKVFWNGTPEEGVCILSKDGIKRRQAQLPEELGIDLGGNNDYRYRGW